MKITVNFNSGEQTIVYGLSPLDLALAVVAAYGDGKLEFQTAASIEDAVRVYNEKKIIS